MASENDDLRAGTHRFAAALILTSSAASTAVAGVIEFFEEDREEWFVAVFEVTTIDFTGFPNDTFITNQYEDLGVLFLDGDGLVGITDFLALLAVWEFCPPPIGCLTDLDCDGTVRITDLLTLLANWG